MEDVLNIWVTEAQPMEGHWLRLVFNDGNVKYFDCKPLIEQYPIFNPIKDEKVFQNIATDGWTVTWADGTLDIAPEYLYEHSVRPYDTGEEFHLSSAAEEPAEYGK